MSYTVLSIQSDIIESFDLARAVDRVNSDYIQNQNEQRRKSVIIAVYYKLCSSYT